jgi:hypothetical protein
LPLSLAAAEADGLGDIGQKLKRVGEVKRAAEQYAKKLGLEDKPGRDATALLSARGFNCRTKFVQYGARDKGRPVIECVKAPAPEAHPECLWLEITVSVKQDLQRPVDELLREVPERPVDLVGAVCKIR